MEKISITTFVFISIILFSYLSITNPICQPVQAEEKIIFLDKLYHTTRGDNNSAPVLTEPYINYNINENDNLEAVFEIYYSDADGDDGEVFVFINDTSIKMGTLDMDPTRGQYYYGRILESKINDYTEFYFYADDNNGSNVTLKDEDQDPFLVGDFLGWGEEPILSGPAIFYDGDDWVFNVTYSDPDGDEAEDLYIYIIGQDAVYMETKDTDPLAGQNYTAKVLESKIDKETEFYFAVTDTGGSYAELYDEDWDYLVVGDFIDSSGPTNGNGNGGGVVDVDTDGDGTLDSVDAFPNDAAASLDSDGDNYPNNWNQGKSVKDSTTNLTIDAYPNDPTKWNPEEEEGDDGFGRWGDPEVIVAIIALIGMAAGSIAGIWFRTRKRKRFSALLTKIDEVYSSYKMHPRKCERELEKIKTEVDEDLKSNVIDENNYSILKDRIGEIIQEIRSESLRSKVQDLPKDMEIGIKDMLIDGQISQAEYKKFMKLLKGSTMTSSDKKEMQKIVQAWLKQDQKKIRK